MSRPGTFWPLAAGLATYVALSAFLALSGGRPWAVEATVATMQQVWATWLVPDLVFVVGSLVTGYVAFGFSREGRVRLGLFLGVVGTLATYELSYFLFSGEGFRGGHMMRTVMFPLLNGVLGIVFASVAPVLMGRPWDAPPVPRRSPKGLSRATR